MPQILHNLSPLKRNRKFLRNNSTSAESTLWNYLKSSQLEGRKFRRQHSIEHFIVDFYCPAERLAIELDGAEHFEGYGLEKDTERDKFLLGKMKITVLRFENREVFEYLEFVLNEIRRHFRN